MKKLALGLCLALIATASMSANALTWNGLTIQENTTYADASVDSNGYLIVDSIDNSADPVTDNWKVWSDLTSLPYTSADYAMGVFIEFDLLDVTGGTAGGARAYLDTWEDRDGAGPGPNREYMFQAGIYEGFGDYVKNRSGYEVPGGWQTTNWYFGPPRVANSVHTMRVELNTTSDTAKFFFDGVLLDTFTGPATVPTFFETVFFGVNGANGTQAVYTDFRHGVVPEPATISLLGLGLAGLAARRIRRKK